MFNSRNPAYRFPTGAVPNCLAVHFKITMPRDLHCSAARLHVRSDAAGKEQILGMFWCGMNGDQYEWWECHFAAPEAGLFFYWFDVDTWRGTLKMTRGRAGEGTLQGGNDLWQLTVYDRNYTVPDWLAGGIIYQIFPDRFYRSGEEKQGVPADRRLHESWNEKPDWEPNAEGKVTNSDYFGGDLRGIGEKLGYLKSLGVTCIYLNPIFESHSNHRYDTADYTKIDPLLGTEEDFRKLCADAKKLGIRILLDGVFSHTGSDSVYFNRGGRYPEPGAYQSQQSPYYSWYRFRRWPDDYECWWDFLTLPNVDELNPEYRRYINGRGGVIQKWLKAGASGWRLDVADELPDRFLDDLRIAAKSQDPQSLIAGEVWEDASNKAAYGVRRRYLQGNQLDSVMNYPFRNAVIGFLTGGNPTDAMEQILSIVENYPPQVLRVLMNNIGTHDTERALTALAGEPLRGHGRHWQSTAHLTRDRRKRGVRLLRLASLMQYTLPGVPCLYYGDEAGMEGYRDPFNRDPFPWGSEDAELLAWYRRLGEFRAKCSCLREGEIHPVSADGSLLAYERSDADMRLLCVFNNADAAASLYVSGEWRGASAFAGTVPDSRNELKLEPLGCAALVLKKPVPAPVEKSVPGKRKLEVASVSETDPLEREEAAK